MRRGSTTPSKPYKFTREKRDRYLQLLREGMRRGAAAAAVGVTRWTVSQACKEDPDFAAAVEQAELDAHEQVENALFQAALGGNVTAIQVWLYNRCPDRWQDCRRVKNEVSGPGGGPVRHESKADIDWSCATVEELRHLRDLQQRVTERASLPAQHNEN